METVSMQSLLKENEEKLLNELRADTLIDGNAAKSTARLSSLLEQMLLRYNAACADEPVRQALAECMSVTAREMLDLPLAVSAAKETEHRKIRTGSVICLLLAVICGLLSVMLILDLFVPGIVLLCAAALFAYLSGRLWYGEREVRVRTEADPEQILKTLKRTAETMDRKADEFMAQQLIPAQSAAHGSCSSSSAPVSDDELRLFADLLEALYAENGDFALRQLRKLLPYLESRGISAADYSPEDAELFEILPSRTEAVTIRPALFSDGKLLLPGRATEVSR